jgi:helicase MOV-10
MHFGQPPSSRFGRETSECPRGYVMYLPSFPTPPPLPSTGDQILIQRQQDTSHKWFQGFVHIVRRDDVGLRFSLSFGSQATANTLFNVRFKFNRIPMRRQHQAMDRSYLLGKRLLFPLGNASTNAAHLKAQRKAHGAPKMFNPLISSNEKQLQAVSAILGRPAGSTPFIIFGPYVFLCPIQ